MHICTTQVSVLYLKKTYFNQTQLLLRKHVNYLNNTRNKIFVAKEQLTKFDFDRSNNSEEYEVAWLYFFLTTDDNWVQTISFLLRSLVQSA